MRVVSGWMLDIGGAVRLQISSSLSTPSTATLSGTFEIRDLAGFQEFLAGDVVAGQDADRLRQAGQPVGHEEAVVGEGARRVDPELVSVEAQLVHARVRTRAPLHGPSEPRVAAVGEVPDPAHREVFDRPLSR